MLNTASLALNPTMQRITGRHFQSNPLMDIQNHYTRLKALRDQKINFCFILIVQFQPFAHKKTFAVPFLFNTLKSC